jgi:hypothetical protein
LEVAKLFVDVSDFDAHDSLLVFMRVAFLVAVLR